MKKRTTKLTLEILKASDDKSFFGHLVARNGNVLAHTETYTRKANVKKAFTAIMNAGWELNYEIRDLTKFTR